MMTLDKIRKFEGISPSQLFLNEVSFKLFNSKYRNLIGFTDTYTEGSNCFQIFPKGDVKFLNAFSSDYELKIAPVIHKWALDNGYLVKNNFYLREILKDTKLPKGGDVFFQGDGHYIRYETYESAQAEGELHYGPPFIDEDSDLMMTNKLKEELPRTSYSQFCARGHALELFLLKETDFHGYVHPCFGEIEGMILPEYYDHFRVRDLILL